MTRPKRAPTAADVDAEIRRLMDERERLVAEEDRQRGALLRAYLAGPEAEALRALLARLAEPRDSYLFGLGSGTHGSGTARSSGRTRAAPQERETAALTA